MKSHKKHLSLTLKPLKITRALSFAAGVLAILGVAASIVLLSEPARGTGALRLFTLGDDGNVPTWFSSVLLGLCGVLLALIAGVRKKLKLPEVWHWTFLSFVFFALSVDDVATVHERLGDLLTKQLSMVRELGGAFSYSWILLGLPAVVMLAIALSPWFFRLPSRTRVLFAISAICFVGGAIGLEMVNASIAYGRGSENLQYQLVTAVEEILEMAGPIIFLYALLGHLRTMVGSITIELQAPSCCE
ncbi:hypothetical protein G7A66_04390 [Altererythrobacter sp. SALINAS58]|uniref:hypothetical protein n=1 Tax=Alteripontixanthobacter muriae TaxID=2705546 RepID=UPI001576A0AC|nr:hypothetical protein [Alteripontixanthobacter muriae]NTZ42343.1 hypothetical protein [Alteripontixanthobacter muriae]